MFALDEKTRFYLCQRPVSMRYGIKGLTSLVLSFPGFSPMSGCAFVFFSADRRQVKILRWDGDGFYCIRKDWPKVGSERWSTGVLTGVCASRMRRYIF